MAKSESAGTKCQNGNYSVSAANNIDLGRQKLPIDKGWAWVILFAATLSQFILMGQVKCFGIIFVQLQKRYNSSSSETAIIPMIQCAVYSIVSFLVMTVGQNLSTRKSVMIGAIFATLSSLLTAFADDINVAYVTLGIAVGLSHAFIMPQTPALLSMYFERRRGFANSINNSGASLGGLTQAPLVTLLFEQYGFTGTFIILTGFSLNIIVIGALLRPLEFFQRSMKTPSSLLLRQDRKRSSTQDAENETMIDRDLQENNIDEHVNIDEGVGDELHYGIQNSSRNSVSLLGNFKAFCTSVTSRMFNKRLLSKPGFHYFLVCNVFLCAGATTASAFLPPHAIERGASDAQAAWMVSTISIVDFIARFLFGWFTDKHWCRTTTLLAVSYGLLGTSAICIHFMTSFSTIMIYAVIAGLFQGLYFSLFVVIILDFLSVEDIKPAIGFTSLIQGVSSGLCYLLLGYIRDVSGNYLLSFDCVGIISIIGAVMIFFLPKLNKQR